MSKRRLACPQTVQHVWDSVVCIRQQKQFPNVDRIANFMRRKHGLSQSDLERQISFALRDGLLRITRKVGCKGSKTGVEQEGYRLPDNELEKDGHDWYCFECHRGGEVCLCTSCHRVYHTFCVKEDVATADNFQCAICKMCKSKNNFKMKKSDLNTLLTYTCNRLKEKEVKIQDAAATVADTDLEVKRVSSNSSVVSEERKTRDLHHLPHSEDEKWRHNLLLFHHVDLNAMEEKANAGEYKRLEEFQADAQSIVHNVVIYYGVHSPMADMARQMLRDCIYDLGEIRQCRDCYRMSNEKKDKFWFCQPCSPPHELVYAKQKGFPYWPAKVIRKTNGVFDVRFFGGYHQRANIEQEYIKSINTNIHSLAIKRTVSWNRACEELRRHQELLEKQKKDAKSRRGAKDVDSEEESEVEAEDGDEEMQTDQEEEKKPKKADVKETTSKAEPKEKDKEVEKDKVKVKEKNVKEEMDVDEEKDNEKPKEKEKDKEKVKLTPKEKLKEKEKEKAKEKEKMLKEKEKAKEKEKMLKEKEKTKEKAKEKAKDKAKEKAKEKMKEKVKEKEKEQEDSDAESEVEASHDESSISSSSKTVKQFKEAPTPEDYNVVSSSSQEASNLRISVSTQTSKKMSPGKLPSKSVQTDFDLPSPGKCGPKCGRQLKERLEEEFKADKELALKELSEKLQKEFDEQKQEAVTSALNTVQKEVEKAKQQVEEKLQRENQQEIQSISDRHRTQISETKKKQWCYNCEAEAIYHCCWNTSYCSIECQQVHWQKEHKRNCRRKR